MEANLQATPTSAFFSLVLVLIAVAVSYKEKLGLEKEIIWSVTRMIIQLIVVGFILEFIFDVNNLWLTLAMAAVIIFNAAVNAAQRGKGLEHSFRNSLIALFTSSVITLAALILSGSLEVIPSQIIPITGMIVGGAMRAVGLAYSNLLQLYKDQEQAVLERLALGATPYQASKNILRITIKNGLQPTIDSIKTTGLVTLPGMMAGLMFAGVDPAMAIIYQIVVMFMMIAATAIATYIATYLAYRSFFNDRYQLRTRIIEEKN
jgi:putative ABC transport system permease protein